MVRTVSAFFVLLALGVAASGGEAQVDTVLGGGPVSIPALSAGIPYPDGLALDSAGNVYFGSYELHRVFRVDSSGTLTVAAGAGNLTLFSTGESGGAKDIPLWDVTDVALDAAGNLYVISGLDNMIYRVDAATGQATRFAGSSRVAGFAGDGGPAALARLSQPQGIALDGAGNLYIADTGNARLRMVSAATGVITTILGNGVSADTGDGGPAAAASINRPNDVTVDAAGNVYVLGYGRIRRISPSGVVTTIAGNGFPSTPATEARRSPRASGTPGSWRATPPATSS